MLTLKCPTCHHVNDVHMLRFNQVEEAVEIVCTSCEKKLFVPLEIVEGEEGPILRSNEALATRQFHAENTVLLNDGRGDMQVLEFSKTWAPAERNELEQRVHDTGLSVSQDIVGAFLEGIDDWNQKKTHELFATVAWETDSIAELGQLYRLVKDLRPKDGWADKGIKMVMIQALGQMQMQSPRRSGEQHGLTSRSRFLIFGAIVMTILAFGLLYFGAAQEQQQQQVDVRIQKRHGEQK